MEQAVALDALASIGGQEARQVASGLLDGRVVQGPTLKVAVRDAAALRCRLSAATVLPLLRHADPEVRAIACNIARDLTNVALDALALIDDPLAFKLAAALPSRMDPRDRDEDAKTTGFRDRSDAS